MKKPIIIGLFFFVCGFCSAQSPEALKKIEAARIAFLTVRLDLSPEEAKVFWPLYNEYSQKRQNLRKEYLRLRKGLKEGQLTEEEGEKLVARGMQLKEQNLALEKEYAEKLIEVIGAPKVVALNKAERDFKRMLLERLQKRKAKRKN